MSPPDDRDRDPTVRGIKSPATDATVASAPAAPITSDPTLAAPSQPPPAPRRPPAVVAGGDYGSLLTVDPNHYVIDRELAKGGMGRILTARDRRLGRQVALKELLHSDSWTRARFEREARITARLQHPAIVNILEAAWRPPR
jgi:serine/threonine protein kinase